MIVFVIIVKVVNKAADRITHRYLRGLVGGALIGCLAVALPLTIGAGNSQLTAVIDNSATISVGLLLAVLIGKMLAMALSLATGFIGGNVTPGHWARRRPGRPSAVPLPQLAEQARQWLTVSPGGHVRRKQVPTPGTAPRSTSRREPGGWTTHCG